MFPFRSPCATAQRSTEKGVEACTITPLPAKLLNANLRTRTFRRRHEQAHDRRANGHGHQPSAHPSLGNAASPLPILRRLTGLTWPDDVVEQRARREPGEDVQVGFEFVAHLSPHSSLAMTGILSWAMM